MKFKAKRDVDVDVGPMLDRLDKLATSVVDRVVLKAMRAEVRQIATAERNQTRRNATYEQTEDSRRRGHRTVAKAMTAAIGSKVKKTGVGNVTAKAGFSVGKKTIAARSSSQGVGISGNNAHWFGLGTRSRTTGSVKSGNRRKATGKPARRRGGLVPLDPSFRALNFSTRVLDQLTRQEMEAEVTRLATS